MVSKQVFDVGNRSNQQTHKEQITTKNRNKKANHTAFYLVPQLNHLCGLGIHSSHQWNFTVYRMKNGVQVTSAAYSKYLWPRFTSSIIIIPLSRYRGSCPWSPSVGGAPEPRIVSEVQIRPYHATQKQQLIMFFSWIHDSVHVMQFSVLYTNGNDNWFSLERTGTNMSNNESAFHQ